MNIMKHKSIGIIILILYSTISHASSFEKVEMDGTLYKNENFIFEKFEMEVEIFVGKKSPSPTIVYAHGCSGWDDYEKSKALLINSWGFNVVVPKYTKSRGFSNGKNPTCTRGWLVYSPAARASDLNNIAIWVKKQDWHQGKIGLIGFSLGAGAGEYVLFNPIDEFRWDGIVVFYPNCRVPDMVENNLIPHQFHLPDKDENFYRCMERNISKTRNYFIYEGATHSFDNNWRGRNRNGYQYDPAATRLSFDRVSNFFELNLR